MDHSAQNIESEVHPLKKLYHYGGVYQSRFLVASLHSVLNKIFDLAPPLLIGMAVEVVVQKGIPSLAWTSFESMMEQLVLVAILTVIIWVAESVFEYLAAIHWRNLAQELQHHLRLDSYRHLQDLEIKHLEDRSTGALLTVINDDVNQLERFLDSGANDIIQLVTTVLIVGGIFFYVQPSVAALAILPMPLIVFASIRFQRNLQPLYREVRDHAGLLNEELSNHLQGMATIKAFHAQAQELGKMSI